MKLIKQEIRSLQPDPSKVAIVNASQEGVLGGGSQEGGWKGLCSGNADRTLEQQFCSSTSNYSYFQGSDKHDGNGDIRRGSDWNEGVARAWYIKEQTLAPKLGAGSVVSTVGPKGVSAKRDDSYKVLVNTWVAVISQAKEENIELLLCTNIGAGVWGGDPYTCRDTFIEATTLADPNKRINYICNGFPTEN